jgi:stage II sporulation protein E
MNRELLDMLNSFLRLRCESSAQECSATLDLLQLDTVSGEAIFFKSGAAPTYVCHGGNLFKLRSRTMPLGILAEPDVKEMHIDLDAGDMVVMMSDGVTGGREDCPYLFDLLRQNADSLGGSRTADLILKYARSNPEPDDVSLFVIKITG